MESFKTRGLQIAEPTPELTAEMQKVAKEGVWQKWTNAQEKWKFPGKRVLEAYLRLREKNLAANPFIK